MTVEFVFPSLVLLVNLLITLVYLFFLSNKDGKERFLRMPFIAQKAFVLLFVGPLFISPLLPQTRVEIGILRYPVGIPICIVGLLLICFSFFKIGAVPSIREKSHLVTSGVYGIVRHPIYSGTVIAFLGISISQSALISLIYFPVSVSLYYIMAVYEERDLIREYGEEYISYSKNVTKRLIPFPFSDQSDHSLLLPLAPVI